MFSTVTTILALCIISVSVGNAKIQAGKPGLAEKRPMSDVSTCAVRASIRSGAVCGALRTSYGGAPYASFRGVPYAKQPIGQLRFLAPQPVEPWAGYFDATYEGPICPQTNLLYGPMMEPRSMGEDCLRVNVHVPAHALPGPGEQCAGAACLPVLVYIPGGGFQFGSGDSDQNGPEYMVDENVILVTFNYRLGAFGFLSLNTSSVPGNAGLRDMVAALEWVQHNVRAFGGDPRQVTLMGQSAGASAAHLLSLSKAATGLFTKVILMSGTASSGFFTTAPSYSQYILSSFLELLNITSTDAEDILNQLIELPYETINDANTQIVQSLGLSSFNPVVESQFEGVNRILDEDPDVLVEQGRGNNYPLVVGFTNVECESLRRRLEDLDIMSKIQQTPTAILPPKLLFTATNETLAAAAQLLIEKYLNGTWSLDKYVPCCSDSLFIYPALKLAETRATTGGAPVFLYEFSYSSDFVATKQAFGLNFTGAGHIDDLSYVLRVNSILNDTRLNSSDESVKDWMTTIVSNFIRHSKPTGGRRDAAWPAVSQRLRYQHIKGAAYTTTSLTADQQDMVHMFDSFYQPV